MSSEPRPDTKRAQASPPHNGLLMTALAGLLLNTMLGPIATMSDLPGLGEQSPVRAVGYILLLLLTLAALRPTRDWKRVLSIPVPVLITLAWFWISILWAISPAVAFSHCVLTSIVAWVLFSTVRYIGYERAVLILRMMLLVFVVINFASVMLAPEFAIHQVNEPFDKTLIGDWRGVMQHKNLLGAFAAATILAFVFDCERIALFLRAAVIAAAAVLLMQSGSKTSFGMVIGALCIGFIFQFYDVKYRPLALSVIGLISLSAILAAFLYADPLKVTLSNPTAFTGRTVIWQAVADYWLDNPFTGSGFGSFWAIGPDSPIFTYASGWVTQTFSTHNGYLALLAETGVVGLVLAFYSGVVWPLTRLVGARAIQGQRSALLIALLFFSIGHNATETSLYDRDVLVNVIIMLVIAIIAWGGRAVSAQPMSFNLSKKLL